MGLLRFILLFVCLAPAVVAQSEQPARLARIEAAFDRWLAIHQLNGVLAVRRAHRDLTVVERGKAGDTPVELASLSKAISAVCASELVRAGRLSWGDTWTVGDDVFRLGDLITHSAGLGPDGTQIAMGSWLDQPDAHRSADVAGLITQRGGNAATSGTFSYNNENYALIALLIEDATGRDYESVCREAALEPAGVSGAPSQRSGAFLPWGGWAMTVADYTRFHGHWFGGEDPTGRSPLDGPHVAVQEGIYYGLGSFFRVGNDANNFWHFGALCFPGRLEVGSFAVTWRGDWSVTAAYDGCVDWDAMFALDQALAVAVFGVLE